MGYVIETENHHLRSINTSPKFESLTINWQYDTNVHGYDNWTLEWT